VLPDCKYTLFDFSWRKKFADEIALLGLGMAVIPVYVMKAV
jgi:hypothetical protein